MSRARGEWPLVAFTVLGQAAAGMFAALALARLLLRGAMDDEAASQLLAGPTLAVGVILGAALLLSTRHLARPMRAWQALRNVAGSWVSAEVALGAAFAVSGAVFAGLELLGVQPRWIRDGLCAITALSGLGFVGSMGQVYRLPALPAWDHPSTPVGFFATTAWLGSLAGAAALAASASRTLAPASLFPEHLAALDDAVRWLAGAAVAASLLDVLAAFTHQTIRRAVSAGASLPASAASLRTHGRLAAGRAVLTLVAAAAAGAFAFRQPPWSVLEPEGVALLAGGLVLAVAASTIGRVSFYAEGPRGGI